MEGKEADRRRPGRPILVTGAHRSGTTWVGEILAASPAVHYVHEPFHPRRPPSAGISALRAPHWYWEPYGRDRRRARRALASTVALRYDLVAALRGVRSRRDLRRIRGEMRALRLAHGRGARALLKDPIALLSAEWLAADLGMEVVVMIRHPAAFAVSLKRLDWNFPFSTLLAQEELVETRLAPFEAEIREFDRDTPGIVEQAAFVWKILHHVIATYRAAHPDWIFLRNEDVSRDPFGQFRALFGRLALPFGGGIDEAIATYTTPGNPRDASDGVVLDLRRDSRASADAWRHLLTRDEIERVRRGVGDVGPLFYAAEEW